jgi:putative membrane protein
MKDKPLNLILGGVFIILILGLTGFFTNDRGTWLMEVTPVLIAFPVLFFTYKSFPLTPLLYVLIIIHAWF